MDVVSAETKAKSLGAGLPRQGAGHTRTNPVPSQKSCFKSVRSGTFWQPWFHGGVLTKIDLSGVLARPKGLARHVRTVHLLKIHVSSQYAAELVGRLDFIGTSSPKLIQIASWRGPTGCPDKYEPCTLKYHASWQ